MNPLIEMNATTAIIEFLDFSDRIMPRAWKINMIDPHRDGEGRTHIEVVTDDLLDLTAQLEKYRLRS